MKRDLRLIVFMMALLMAGINSVSAQGRLLRRIQEEVEKKAVEKVFNNEDAKETQPQKGEETPGNTGRNRGGGGLSQAVPDVNQAIADAAQNFSSRDYTLSKAAMREAIWGVELEMGQNVLKSLPEKVQSLNMVSGSDNVSSSGMGFVGMLIERVYSDGDEQEFTVSVGNDAAILGLGNMMIAGDMFRQSMDQPNQKQIRFQEHRAIIEYDDYSGYTLTTPFGQTSILVLKGVNMGTEKEFMAAANQIDLNVIKQKLGEQ